MEGENSKQTFKKNILDIPSVLSGRVRPLLNAIVAKKKEVAATSDKISKIVNDIYDRQEEEALKERAAQEAAARAGRVPCPKPCPSAAAACHAFYLFVLAGLISYCAGCLTC